MLHVAGMPKEDVDFIHCDGPVMESLLKRAEPRQTLFTGSSNVAERLARTLRGKLKIEDAGYDWKIVGHDLEEKDIPFLAYTADQDAYAHTGQKCSAQSIIFIPDNEKGDKLLEAMANQAARRSLSDLTIGPVLTWNN